ncbi:MAG: hypothetical protein RMK94_13365 [Armatimonadota bacterium]|nr:hypothetical protein [Armatimonadota bacterium]
MKRWVVLLRGLPSEVTPAQALLNAHQIPTIMRTIVEIGGIMELLVPDDKFSDAKELLLAVNQNTDENDEVRGEWDE